MIHLYKQQFFTHVVCPRVLWNDTLSPSLSFSVPPLGTNALNISLKTSCQGVRSIYFAWIDLMPIVDALLLFAIISQIWMRFKKGESLF